MTKGKHSRKSAAARRYKGPRRPIAASAEASPAAAAPSQEVATAKTVATSAKSAMASKVVDLVSEYRYVLSDLKRLGLLAAAMFALLVALALLIR